MGLCHDVNGRVASLGAVIQLVELGESIPDSFPAELDRLEDVARRMTLLVGHLEAPPAALPIGDLVDRAVELQRNLKDLGGGTVRVDRASGLPPVLVNEGRCFRALALFVDLAGRWGADGITLGGDADGVDVTFEVDPERLDHDALASLDRVVALDGGTVAGDGGRCAFELPSLSRARAEGR